jgi:hypothetical protein
MTFNAIAIIVTVRTPTGSDLSRPPEGDSNPVHSQRKRPLNSTLCSLRRCVDLGRPQQAGATIDGVESSEFRIRQQV